MKTIQAMPYCVECLNHITDMDATTCNHCSTQESASATTLDRLRSRGRGSVLLTALGVSFSLSACEPSKAPDASIVSIATEPQEVVIPGAGMAPELPEPPVQVMTPTPLAEPYQPTTFHGNVIENGSRTITLTAEGAGGVSFETGTTLRAALESLELIQQEREQRMGRRSSRLRRESPIPIYGGPPTD